MTRLLIVEGPLKGQSYEISDGATVGRSRSCTVRIEGRHVSRIHCKFEKRGEQFVVLDNESRNGIFVNGHKVKEKPLAGDDEVEVGEYVLVFEPSAELIAAVSNPKAESTAAPSPAPAAGAAPAAEGEAGTSRRDFSRVRAATTVLDSILDPFADGAIPEKPILDILRAVSAADDDAGALKALLDRVVDALKAGRGFIMLSDNRGKLTPAVKRAPANDDEFYLSNVLFHQIAREKRSVLATDTGRKGAAEGKPVTIIASPMIHRGAVLGFVYIETASDDSQATKPRFTNADLRFVAGVTSMATPSVALLRRASKALRAYDSARRRLELQHKLVGENPAIRQVSELIGATAPTESAILIMGERGTGKSLAARAIHARSTRALQPFIAVNCAAITPSLVASELFGHEKNAFPGATEAKRGLMEMAHGGTIYLEEIGELPPEAQAVLLRLLEGHSFARVGGADRVHVDVRMIGATTHDLEKEMQTGKIKKELYWNLATTVLKLPPLRERRDDVARLVRHFLDVDGGRISGTVEDHVAAEVLTALQSANWPGNVTELRVAVEMMLQAAGAARITTEHWKR